MCCYILPVPLRLLGSFECGVVLFEKLEAPVTVCNQPGDPSIVRVHKSWIGSLGMYKGTGTGMEEEEFDGKEALSKEQNDGETNNLNTSSTGC